MNNDTLNKILNYADETMSHKESTTQESFMNSLCDQKEISSFEHEMLNKCTNMKDLKKCAMKIMESPYREQATMNQISEQITDSGYPDNSKITN